MKRLLFVACTLFFLFGSPCMADLTYPAVFEIKEEQSGQFLLSLTVPLVKGRYLKLHPVLPDGFRVIEEPEVNAGEASLTHSWMAEPPPDALYSAPFGLEGLLGTAHQVQFSLTTLDGRRFEHILRPTQPFFRIPRPKMPDELMVEYGRRGLRDSIRSFGMWSILAALIFCGLSNRNKAICILFPLTGFLLYRILALPAFPPAFSDPEQKLAAASLISGSLLGSIGILLALKLFRSLLQKTICLRISFYAWILATAWTMYQGAGLFYHHGLFWAETLQRLLSNLGQHWFSPFAADWAMARFRIPLLSIFALTLLIICIIKMKHKAMKLSLSIGLLISTFFLLPYGVVRAEIPFASPSSLSAKQAQIIIEPMLVEVYHALNLEDENQMYDKLAQQVCGSLVTDLYLDSRRRLTSGTRDGAIVTVKHVELQNAAIHPPAGNGMPTYRCSWTVTAKVTHWQHTHERNNLYEGDLSLIVENQTWKLASMNLISEERKVVPGSFSSR